MHMTAATQTARPVMHWAWGLAVVAVVLTGCTAAPTPRGEVTGQSFAAEDGIQNASYAR